MTFTELLDSIEARAYVRYIVNTQEQGGLVALRGGHTLQRHDVTVICENPNNSALDVEITVPVNYYNQAAAADAEFPPEAHLADSALDRQAPSKAEPTTAGVASNAVFKYLETTKALGAASDWGIVKEQKMGDTTGIVVIFEGVDATKNDALGVGPAPDYPFVIAYFAEEIRIKKYRGDLPVEA